MLRNLKILDFTTLLPGPYATFMLASMGAKVTKVSAPGKPDLVLEDGPRASTGDTANKIWLNHRKDEIVANLKDSNDLEKIKQLLRDGEYNCIIEQFRPGVMDKLGLGYEAVKELVPDIIYTSLSGYGQFGEYVDRAGHDINYLSLSGNMSYSGRVEHGPELYGMQIADIASAQNAIIGTLAAHNQRVLDGKGSHVDVSILDSVIPFNTMSGVGALLSGNNPERESQWLNGGSMYDFYETSDNQYMSVGSLEPKFWKRFCEVMGHEDWIEAGCVCPDFKEKKVIVREQFKQKTRKEWEAIFEGKDACVEPVLTVTEALLERKNAKMRDAIVDIKDDKYTEDNIWIYGNPIKFLDK